MKYLMLLDVFAIILFLASMLYCTFQSTVPSNTMMLCVITFYLIALFAITKAQKLQVKLDLLNIKDCSIQNKYFITNSETGETREVSEAEFYVSTQLQSIHTKRIRGLYEKQNCKDNSKNSTK